MKYFSIQIGFMPFCWRLYCHKGADTKWRQAHLMVGPFLFSFYNFYWPNKEAYGGFKGYCRMVKENAK